MIEFDEHTAKSNGLDLTPMIDIVFNLLIFFLLTSIFARPHLPLNLPEAETARVAAEAKVSVAIQRDGRIQLNGQELQLTELFIGLKELYQTGTAKNISLISDKGVPFGRVVEIMDIAKKAGAESISVMAERKR